MHEHAVMTDLMRGILRTAEEEKAARVVAVSVRLGALSHMTPAHFAQHFKTMAAGTIAEGAAINTVTSDDIHDPRATGIVLTGIDVETDP